MLTPRDVYRVWHPNTQMGEWDRFPRIVEGDGMWLVDSAGKRMLDGVASMWCNVWGHSNREIVSAIARQAESFQHVPLFNLAHEPATVLARRLVSMSAGMHRAFFSDNGSSAVEVALKMAMQYWKNRQDETRKRFASLIGGYHGDTFGAMSVGYSGGFFAKYRSHLFGTRRIRAPKTLDDMEQKLDRIDGLLAKRTTISVIMESGAQLAAGAVIYPDGFQSRVARLCRKHDTILILDEVATGFGRLGHMVEYAAQHGRPDIVVYGKMLTGGYLTMAATLATKKIHDAFLGAFDNRLFHGHTYTGNPLAAAASIQNLRMYKKYSLIKKISKTSKVFDEHRERFLSARSVSAVRHRGMLMGIDVRGNISNRRFFLAGRRRGVYLRTLGSTVMVVPPLAIEQAELDEMLSRVLSTILDLQK